MHVQFTEEELEAIERIPFKWKVKEGSEPTVAKSAKRKIEMLRTQNIGPQKRKEQTTDGEDK